MARRLIALGALALAATVSLTACSGSGSQSASPTTASSASVASSAPATASPATGSASSSASAGAKQQEVSTQFATDFEQGKPDAILAAASDQVKKSGLSASMLTTARAQINAQAGDFQKVLGSYTQSNPQGDLVYVITQHTKKPVRILFSYVPGTTSLNGLNLNLATDDEVKQATAAASPSASGSSSASSSVGITGPDATDESVQVGTYKLPGTLATPRTATRKQIAVILLPGSGPQDRDETTGAANNKPLRDIADGLAAQGITTLRFDKRTKAAPTSLGTNFTLADEYFDDTTAAVQLLAQRSDLHGYKVFLLGHSQAGMLLPTMLKQNPGLAGGISLAGSPRSLFDIMYDQFAAQVAASGKSAAEQKTLLAQDRALMDQAKKLTDPKATSPAALLKMLPASYIVSLNQQTPVATAKALTVPLLFLQGEADAQVSPTKDFGAWKTDLAGRADTTFTSFPKLNHLFMPTTGKPAPADYDTKATVDPAVTAAIADWLTSHA